MYFTRTMTKKYFIVIIDISKYDTILFIVDAS